MLSGSRPCEAQRIIHSNDLGPGFIPPNSPIARESSYMIDGKPKLQSSNISFCFQHVSSYFYLFSYILCIDLSLFSNENVKRRREARCFEYAIRTGTYNGLV
ncbi:hypothetical protein I3843_01G182500 [Carya illinoinensis]|nr:hypothetical protein I3843_01G182500 [Carya illinoinensis]